MIDAARPSVRRAPAKTAKATAASAASRSQAARDRAADRLRSEGYLVELPPSAQLMVDVLTEWQELNPTDTERLQLIGILSAYAPRAFQRAVREIARAREEVNARV